MEACCLLAWVCGGGGVVAWWERASWLLRRHSSAVVTRRCCCSPALALAAPLTLVRPSSVVAASPRPTAHTQARSTTHTH